MQRDERMLDSGLDATIQRVNELRAQINTFIMRLENEYMTTNWTTVLDNFALLSSKLNMLNRQLRSEKLPQMKNFVVFPLQLNPNRDPELERLTEGRVTVFNHELVPLYLRTKPDPEIEDKIQAMAEKSNNLPAEGLQKKIGTMNKAASNAVEQMRTYRETNDSESSQQRHTLPQLCLQADTLALVSAVTYGKGIKSSQRPITPSSATPAAAAAGSMQQQSKQQGATADQRSMGQSPGGSGMSVGKAPSSIKTNIKAAAMNPYSR